MLTVRDELLKVNEVLVIIESDFFLIIIFCSIEGMAVVYFQQ